MSLTNLYDRLVAYGHAEQERETQRIAETVAAARAHNGDVLHANHPLNVAFRSKPRFTLSGRPIHLS